VHHKIPDRFDTPEFDALMRIADPYSYRDRLVMPKYIVNASGDQFFCPDSSQFYFDELLGEKYLRYVPNADHSLDGSDAVESILAFYKSVLANSPRPKFTWRIAPEGAILVKAEDRPKAVSLWQATAEKARDFRLETIGAAYQRSPLTDRGSGRYVAEVPPPEKGWTAFFVELVYDGPGQEPLKFTTGICVVPDVLPHEGEFASSSRGEAAPRASR
jgi:PhoPQ-activated pathogenicity-related protein